MGRKAFVWVSSSGLQGTWDVLRYAERRRLGFISRAAISTWWMSSQMQMVCEFIVTATPSPSLSTEAGREVEAFQIFESSDSNHSPATLPGAVLTLVVKIREVQLQKRYLLWKQCSVFLEQQMTGDNTQLNINARPKNSTWRVGEVSGLTCSTWPTPKTRQGSPKSALQGIGPSDKWRLQLHIDLLQPPSCLQAEIHLLQAREKDL